MTDIVERLRKPRAGGWDDHKDMFEAAAEIERLWAELARIRGLPRLSTLDDEIKRLRDQLRCLTDSYHQVMQHRADCVAEIERLRRENEVMKAADYEALGGGVTGKDKDMLIAGYKSDLAKASAENERLKDAVAKLLVANKAALAP